MLRISQDEMSNGAVSLRLEGEMTGPWVAEASRYCEAIMADGRRLKIDLAQVTFADRAGLALLARLKQHKVKLDPCSPFLKAQLRLDRPE